MVEIASDAEGMTPESLRETLENWPKSRKFPKIVLSVPVGANPTGTTASEGRKKEM